MKTKTIRNTRRPLAAALSALLAGAAVPAFAADTSCLDSNGNPVVVSTNQGSEHGVQNTTCDVTASAYGYRNDASGDFSSAFGYMNIANGWRSSAFGQSNLAQGGQGAVSIGYGKRIGDRASFSLGASFGSGESSVGGGFGFDL